MIVKHKRTTPYIAIAAVLIVVLLFVPFPHGTSLKAVVTASNHFQVLSNGNGAYSTSHKDLWKNRTLSSRSLLPDRGGLVVYKANPQLSQGLVTAGDTLAWLYSSTLSDKIVSLEGNINTLKASLEFERSGSKETEIEAARLQLTYARARLEEQQKILERSKSLLEGKIIPQQEYDIEVRRERLDAIRVSIAEADLGSALSGAQTRKLDVFRAQIADEEKKMALARDVLSHMTFVSPLSGKLLFPLSEDTLMSVEQVDTLVAMLPIQGGSFNMVEWTSHLTLIGPNFEMNVSPEQMQVDDHILKVGSEQLILVRIRIDNTEGSLVPGQLLEASVKFSSRSVFQMLRELI
ncbi:MAG: hypothetical protein H8E26_01490 [FCB group bacterium]|nr:hypothetical protein [FCB group bacterium]MBL7027917.1 hypothetical protein [Candidatus Neomarinimicrobiota bacterium]MBL7121926.1 hypothetical protein [Candidatus Neomarinimicrobiota bacterium]